MKSQTLYRGRENRRGFTLIIVIMLIAVMAMMGVALLNLLNLDSTLVGQSRRSVQALNITKNKTMEVINNADLPNILPRLDATTLTVLHTASANSVFSEGEIAINGNIAMQDDYQSKLSLMRIAPLAESSQGLSRAVVYEIVTRSRYKDGDATAEIRTEIYRPTNWEGQSIMPRKHYR